MDAGREFDMRRDLPGVELLAVGDRIDRRVGQHDLPAPFGLGVIVYGRTTFEQANGWRGGHPTGAPVIVLTHQVPDGWPREDSPVSFVTEGIERAIEEAEAIAGERTIALGSPSIILGHP